MIKRNSRGKGSPRTPPGTGTFQPAGYFCNGKGHFKRDCPYALNMIT